MARWAVIKMISQVYYRHNLLIRNRNRISTRADPQRLPDQGLIWSIAMKYFYGLLNWYFTFNKFLLPGFVGFFIVSFFLVNLFFWLCCLHSESTSIAEPDRLARLLSGILVVNQKISCWHRFVIFLMTDTRWVLSVCVLCLVKKYIKSNMFWWLICFLCHSSPPVDGCLNWFWFGNVIYIGPGGP